MDELYNPSPDLANSMADRSDTSSASIPSFYSLADFVAQFKTEEQRKQALKELSHLADEILKLVNDKQANGGTLPPGTLPRAAFKLGLSEDQVFRLIKRMEQHQNARKNGLPVGPRISAVIPGRKGRQKGKRDVPPKVQEFIIDAWKSQEWDSLNHLGQVDKIECPLNRTMIYKLVVQKYPSLKISRTTVWRIINEYEEEQGAKSAYARGREDEVKSSLLTMKCDFGGINNVWIADIRPLPIKSLFKEIECTVGMLYIMDGASAKVLRHKLLPRKDVDDHGNIYGVDFTCQQVREQIVLAILDTRRRPRFIYTDNGAQFGPALEVFLDLLTADGEAPTQIIHTDPGDPRGRGLIERALGLINSFIQYKPGFFAEKNYRKALRRKKSFKFYEFSFLEAEFDHFIPVRNTKAKQKSPSPIEGYDQGIDEGLSLPNNLHLGLFLGSVQRINDRAAHKEGVQYKTKKYVPASPDPAIGAALITAALNKQKVSTLVVTFKSFIVLYIKLPDGTWTELIEKGKRNWSIQKQRKWKQSVTQLLAQDKSASLARLQEELVDELGRKLSIEPFEEDFIKHPQGHDEEIDGNQDECGEKQDTTNLESIADMQDQLKPRNDSPRPTKKKSRTRGTGPQSDEQILHPDTEGGNATVLALDIPVAEQEAVDQVLDVILRRIHRPNLG